MNNTHITTPRKGKVKRIVINILLGFTGLLLVFAVVSSFFFARSDSFLFGYKPCLIGSESMEPVYKKNGLVLLKNGNYDKVRVGSLIAFKADKLGGKVAFHRVIEITENGFMTKGDANKIADEQIVDRDAYLGMELWHTNITAALIPSLQTPKGIVMLVVLPITIIAAIAVLINILRKYVWNKQTNKI